jgi:hypothetical protein
VFSAPNYCDMYKNKSGYLLLGAQDGLRQETMSWEEHPYYLKAHPCCRCFLFAASLCFLLLSLFSCLCVLLLHLSLFVSFFESKSNSLSFASVSLTCLVFVFVQDFQNGLVFSLPFLMDHMSSLIVSLLRAVQKGRPDQPGDDAAAQRLDAQIRKLEKWRTLSHEAKPLVCALLSLLLLFGWLFCLLVCCCLFVVLSVLFVIVITVLFVLFCLSVLMCVVSQVRTEREALFQELRYLSESGSSEELFRRAVEVDATVEMMSPMSVKQATNQTAEAEARSKRRYSSYF